MPVPKDPAGAVSPPPRRRAWRSLFAGVLALTSAFATGTYAQSAGAVAIDTASYLQVSSVRSGRNDVDFAFTVQAVNASRSGATGCIGRVTSSSANTRVIDDSVTFPTVPGLGRATSTDTFTLRHNRLVAFDASVLSWAVSCSGTLNTPPVANAGADQTVFTGVTVTLNGSGSSDADGDPLTFAWTLVSRPAGSTATLSSPTAVMPTFVADRDGRYEIRLIVNDGLVDSAADLVVVTTIPDNTPPIANAGPDQTVLTGDLVTLNGTGSSDVDGDPLSFAWSVVSQPAGSAITLAGANTALPTFTPLVAGDYVVRLTVNDGRGGSASDNVTISTLRRNQPPIANAGADQTVTVGQRVDLDGTASSDPEGTPLTFAWSFVSCPGACPTLQNATTDRPFFTTLRAGNYVVQLIVSDGALASAPDTVLISTNNTPPVANAGPDQTVNEDALVALDGNGSSDANGDPLSFFWSLTTRPAGSVATLANELTPTPTFVADLSGAYVAQLIVNDGTSDSAPDTVTILARPRISIGDRSVNEGDTGTSTASFDVTLSSAFTQPVTVDYATANGTATAGSDYVAASGTLTFAPGVTSQTISVTINGDTTVEPTETFAIDLTNATNATIGDGQATGTIVNDDATIVVTLAATDASAAEAGTNTGTLTVTRSGSTTNALTVSYSVGGTATNGSDYQSIATSVTIPAGAASVAITVTPVDDALNEGEETVVLSLLSSATYTIGTPSQGTVTIADNDLNTVTVVATDATASEPGSNTGTFTVSRSGDTTGTLIVALNFAGTAIELSDFNNVPPSVVFAAGQSTATVTITPRADNLVEGSETVVLSIAASTEYDIGTPGSATVTIADDPPVVSVVATDAAAAEAGPNVGTFTVSRTGGATSSALIVDFALTGTAANGSDYTTIGGSVTIPAGQSSVTVTITPSADNLVEGDETAILTLAASARYQIGSPASATVTIADDPAIVTIVATDAAAAEAGTDPGTFTISRTGGNLTAPLIVSFTRGGSAVELADYANIPVTLVVPANQASATITITPVDDTTVEGDETVVLTISSAASYSLGTPSSATVTIADNDTALPTVTIAASDASASEAGPDSGEFTFTRTGSTTAPLNVFFTFSGTATAGGDYPDPGTFVTIPAGQLSVTRSLTPTRDNLTEPSETAIFTITPNAAYTVGTPSSATVTIADDPVTVAISATDPNASEAGPDPGEFTFTRTNTGNVAAALNVFFAFSGTATAGGDYPDPGLFVTIPAGQLSVTKSLTPNDDALVESAETAIFTIAANASYVIGTPAAATVTIADNESTTTLSVTLTDTLVGVGRSLGGTVTISQAAPAGGTIVNLSSNNTGICTAVPASVTIAAGQTQAPFTANGIGGGTCVITASSTGLTNATVNLTVTSAVISIGAIPNVARTQSLGFAVSLSQPAPAGGVTINFVSVNTGIATVTASVFVPAGLQTPVANPQVTGVALGTTQINASAIGFAPDSRTVNVIETLSFSPTTLTVAQGSTNNITLSLSAPAATGGFVANLTSSDTAVFTVPASVTIPAGQISVSVPVTGIAVGSGRTLTASAPGVTPVNATINVVAAPAISISDAVVGEDLQQSVSASLGAAAPPVVGVTVTVTSADPSRLRLSADPTVLGDASGTITLNVPGGGSSVPVFYLQALAGSGTVSITANAPGYATDVSTITLTPSGFIFNSPGDFTTNAFAANTALSIASARLAPGTLQWQGNQPVRAGLPPVLVAVVSSDTTVGTITTSPVSFSTNVGTQSTAFDPVGGGTSTLSIVPPAGWDNSSTFEPITATVTAPAISVGAVRVGEDLQVGGSASLGATPPTPVDVTITVANPALARVSASATVLGDASGQVVFTGVSVSGIPQFFVQGLSQGATTLTVSAPGYTSTTVTLNVDPSGFIFNSPGNFTTNTFAANTTLQIASSRLTPGTLSWAASQPLRPGLAPVLVAVTSSNPAVGVVTTSPVSFGTNVTFVNTAFDALGAGTSTLDVVPPAGWENSTSFDLITATVTAPNISISAVRVGRDLQMNPSPSLAAVPPAPVDVTFTIADPTLARISASSTALGDASGQLVITGVTTATLPTLFIQGLQIGATTITVSAPGYNPTTVTLTVDPSGFIFNSPGNFSTNTFAANTTVQIASARLTPGTLAWASSQPLRAGLAPVQVQVTSSNTAVGVITTSPVSFAANVTTVNTAFDPLAAGSTTLDIVPPAGWQESSTFDPIVATVTAPTISVSAVRVGEDLQIGVSSFLAATPPNPVDVTISVASTTVARVSTSATVLGDATGQIVFPGQTSTSIPTFFVQGLQQGATTLTISVPGYTSANVTLNVDPSGFIINSPGSITTTAGAVNSGLSIASARLDPITANWASNQVVRPGLGAAVAVDVTSSNTAVGTITVSPVSFGANVGTVNTAFDPASAGVTQVVVQTPSGWNTSNSFRLINATVNP